MAGMGQAAVLEEDSVSVATADTVVLAGRVVDDNQQGLPFVSVRVAGTMVGTLTDMDGKFHLSFTASDSATVVFSLIGYETKEKVLCRPRGRLALNVVLHDKGTEMSEVTVKEVRRQMGQTQTLNTEDLRRLPSTSGNAVEELVATQAGVSTHNELSSQYNVRGGSFDENCVYVNGMEVYRPMLISSGQQEGLSVINSDMVERIDFSAGGFEARYGDRMSSVLDITYRRPTRHEGRVGLSLLGANVYDGVRAGNFTLSQGFRFKSNRYLLGSLQTKGEYDPTFLDYQAYMTYDVGRWHLDLTAYINRNDYRFVPTDRETNFGTSEITRHFKVYFDGEENDLFRTLYGAFNASRTLGKHSSLTLSFGAFSTKERETYDIQGQYWLTDSGNDQELGVGTFMQHARNLLTSTIQTARAVFESKPSGHHIHAGILWKAEQIHENSREWEYRDSAGYSMPHTGDGLNMIYNLKSVQQISSHRMEFHAQDTWRSEARSGIWSINYGARLSYWSWNREWLVSPRASLGYIPAANDNFTFRLATGLYYQSPFYRELRDTTTSQGLTTVTLNPDIRSQRSFQVVLGGEYKFRIGDRPFKFSTELYYKAQSNLNPYNIDNLKVVYYGRNEAKGYVLGADFKLFGEFVPGTDSWITFSLMKASMTLHGKTIPQPTDQRWNLNFFFSDYFPGTDRWKMTLKMAFAGGLPFGPPHTGLERMAFRAPTYRRVDLGMSYRLLNNEDNHRRGFGRHLRNVWLSLECFNLIGVNNVSSYLWINDITNQQYAIPNYLTGRQLNGRITVEW